MSNVWEKSIFEQLNDIDDYKEYNDVGKQFINNIDKDIINLIDTDFSTPITNNYVKCSKSVVPNALYYVNKGETVEFCLGNIEKPSKYITHCWIEHNGKVLQTRVPNPNVNLIKKYSIMLVPNQIDISKNKIISFITKINEKHYNSNNIR